MHHSLSASNGFVRSALLAAALLAVVPHVAAQVPPAPPPSSDTPTSQSPSFPECQPPSQGEYLLLVKSSTSDVQDQVRRTLPTSARSTICNYRDEVVTRVSGFTTVDTANAWARYLNESAGLSAFVARPPEPAPNEVSVPPLATSTPASQPTEAPKPSAQSESPKTPAQVAATSRAPATFNPKPLGTGYAVLVNHSNRPEQASKVQQLTRKNVGLVSYSQRPYLLAVHTSDQAAANAVLKQLRDRGFSVLIVDSRRVMLLRQVVNTQQPTAQN